MKQQIRYVEKSVDVNAVLELNPHARDLIRKRGAGDVLLSSTLTQTETERALVRAVATKRIAEAERRRIVETVRTMFRENWLLLQMTPEILSRASEPFPVEPVRTLDAIHLATAIAAHERFMRPVTFISADDRALDNARALGFEIVDPRKQ